MTINCTGTLTISDNSSSYASGGAFYSLTALSRISINAGTIGTYAFNSCTGLTEITLGTGVTKINNYAFGGCNALTTVNYAGTSTQWGKITIGSSGNDAITNATKVYNYTA